MANMEKEMFDIVNRNHASAVIVDLIEKNLDCDILARKLNAISARRCTKAKKKQLPVPQIPRAAGWK